MIRTGRLEGQTIVTIPWLDTEGVRQYSVLKITGRIYASKLYAGIREFIERNFGYTPDKDWLHHVPLIVNSSDPEVQVQKNETALDEFIEGWIQRIQEPDENQDRTDTDSTSSDSQEAGEPVRSVHDPII